jgi:hypothetical protein
MGFRVNGEKDDEGFVSGAEWTPQKRRRAAALDEANRREV